MIFYMLGFLCGILYANLIAQKYLTETGIFHTYFLSCYTRLKIEDADYLWYLLRWRILPFLILAMSCLTGLGKAAAVLCLLWTGFAAGILAVTGVLRMGGGGILLCLAGMLPQFLFYITGYAVLLWYLYAYPETEWNPAKTVFVAVMMGAGILTEVYVNPGIMKWMMQVLI